MFAAKTFSLILLVLVACQPLCHAQQLEPHEFLSFSHRALSPPTRKKIESCPISITQSGPESTLFRRAYFFCRNECSSDAECNDKLGHDHVCCPTAGCINAHACVGRGRPVTNTPQSSYACDLVKCEANTACIIDKATGAASCQPLERPGVCPLPPASLIGSCKFNKDVNCLDDSRCESGEKCCMVGCNRICMPAVKSCDQIVCGSGQTCVTPQGQGAQCVNKPPKDGLCPSTVSSANRNWFSGPCKNDYDCMGDQKCCSGDYGQNCQYPELTPPKSGTCPYVPPGKPGSCAEHCSIDSNCPDNKKCCFTGCGHVCKRPAAQQPPTCTAPCKAGYVCKIICTGATPCFAACVPDQNRPLCGRVTCRPGYCCQLWDLPRQTCVPCRPAESTQA